MPTGFMVLVGLILLLVILMLVSDKRKEAADKIEMRSRKLKAFVAQLDEAAPDNFAKMAKEAETHLRTLTHNEIVYLKKEVAKIREVTTSQSKRVFLEGVSDRAFYELVEFY
jgi:predicted Holliday junction resolvase-like endonuclease